MPNGTAWPVVAFGASRAGAHRRAAEHVPPPARARGPAPHRGRRAPRAAGRVPRSRLRRRSHGDLARSWSPGRGSWSTPCPRLRTDHRVGRRSAGPRPTTAATRSSSPRSTRRCDRPTTSRSCSRRAAAARPKGVIHTHGGALAATAAGLEVRRLTPRRPPLHPDAVLLGGRLRHRTALRAARRAPPSSPRRGPNPARTLPFLERERVTLFRGWPDQAAALGARPRLRRRRSRRRCARAASTRSCPPTLRAGPGQRAGPARHDRVVRSVQRRTASTRRSRAGKEGSCGQVFDGVEVRVVDLDTGAPVADGETGELQLRGPNLMRGICGRTRAEVFTDDGFYATGDVGHLDADGLPVPHRPPRRHVQGARRDRLPERGRGRVARAAGGAGARSSSTWCGDGGAADVAAVVVLADDAARRDRRRACRATPSSGSARSRCRPAGGIIDGDDVPMTTTGKVDKAGLQQLFGPETLRGPARPS